MSSINGIFGANLSEYVDKTQVANMETESNAEFSRIIAEALEEELTRMSVLANPGVPSSLGPFGSGMLPMAINTHSGGLEQMLLAAASSGEITDAQTALFMLCMMMQSNQNGDFSMVMQMMASIIMQMEDEEGVLRNSVMASRYDPYVLDSIDWGVFGNAWQSGAGMGGVSLPLEFWRPATPVVTSNAANRSAERYNAVIRQFSVETAERYRPFRDGYTYCNIYMWDVTRAMGAEIPLYTDALTGEARYYPDTQGTTSMTAVKMDAWLKKHGADYGWRSVDAQTAQMHANAGKPAVTTAGTIDHVQVICPSRSGGYDPVRGVTIAQAGSRVSSYTHITDIYSANALNNHVSYWIHD